MNKKILGAAVGVALGITSVAEANVIFDPDGVGGDGAITLGSLDWVFTSVLAVDGNQAVANWIANEAVGGAHGGSDEVFTVYYHSRLGSTTDPSNTDNTPTGLNTNYEITSILGFQERVDGVGIVGGDAIATFDFVSPSDVNFFEMYYDTAMNSDALLGEGFNDGSLILSSDIASTTGGSFRNTGGVGLLDQFGGDNWSGQLTITGSGSNDDLNVEIDPGTLSTDSDFFKNELTSFMFSNISLQDPFTSTDPSMCFTAGGGGGLVDCSVPTANSIVPNLGAVNGALPIGGGADEGGPDFMFQTDANSPVAGVIPEPTSLALLGLGLGALGFSAKRGSRRRSSV